MVDWLKLLHTFPRNPKLRLLARRLKCHKLTAQGLAVQWLIFVDEQTTDGCTHLTVEEMDDELGFRGGAAALCDIGWASLDGEGCMVASEFGKHCGVSAKERAEAARRKKSQRERDKYHEKNVTDVTEKAWREEEEEYIHTKGVSKATVSSGRESVDLPPPPDGFLGWVGKVAQAHPSCRKSNVLAPDVEAAARAAFARCPAAAEQAEMLRAYLGDRLQEDRYRHPFYRPSGQARFFENLEDVLAHAERWVRETGWKPAGARCKKKVEKCTADEPLATPEQREEFLRGLREDAEKGGGR